MMLIVDFMLAWLSMHLTYAFIARMKKSKLTARKRAAEIQNDTSNFDVVKLCNRFMLMLNVNFIQSHSKPKAKERQSRCWQLAAPTMTKILDILISMLIFRIYIWRSKCGGKKNKRERDHRSFCSRLHFNLSRCGYECGGDASVHAAINKLDRCKKFSWRDFFCFKRLFDV